MNLGSRGPVVVDTGVFGARLTASGRLLAGLYRPMLEGRPAVVSFVTVAELEYGARLADWGSDRLRRLEYEIGRAEIVWPGPHLTEVYATLRAWCVKTGHGLGQKEHEADCRHGCAELGPAAWPVPGNTGTVWAWMAAGVRWRPDPTTSAVPELPCDHDDRRWCPG
jgi:predicted nucleic acid-binding protein